LTWGSGLGRYTDALINTTKFVDSRSLYMDLDKLVDSGLANLAYFCVISIT